MNILYPLLLNVFGCTVVYLELPELPSLLKIIDYSEYYKREIL